MVNHSAVLGVGISREFFVGRAGELSRVGEAARCSNGGVLSGRGGRRVSERIG